MREKTCKRGYIAVVDDEPLIGEIVQRALERDYEVDVFLDGDALLSAWEEGRRYDLILCDLSMPHRSGRDIYEEAKQLWPKQARRVVFMTGLAPQEARGEMLRGIDNDLIKKPFALNELRTKAHEMMAR